MNRCFVLTVLLLAGTLGAIGVTAKRLPDQLNKPLAEIPTKIGDWTTVQEQKLDSHVLQVLLPTSYLSRTYSKGGRPADLFIAYYAQQRAGESMHSPKNCLPGSGWEIWNYDSAWIPTDSGKVKVNKYSIENAGQRSLVFYWYQSKSRIIASEYVGKILLVRDALLDGRTAGSSVRIIVPDVPGAAEDATLFASKVIPQVQRCFGR